MKKSYDIFGFEDEFDVDFIDWVWYSPAAAFKEGGFLGFGGGGVSGTPTVPSTKFTRWADKKLLPMLVRAMKGKGLGPEGFSSDRLAAQYEGLENAYDIASGELNSNLSRTIHPEDVRVGNFARNQLNRAYITAKDDIRRGERANLQEEQDIATKLAMDTVAKSKQTGLNTAGMFNNANLRSAEIGAQYGTFGTNLAYGAGSGLADIYFAQQMAGK
jgi:hypothetical protein